MKPGLHVAILLFTSAVTGWHIYAQTAPDPRDLLTRSDGPVIDSFNGAGTTTLALQASISLLMEAPGTRTKVDTSITLESSTNRFRYRASAGSVETLTVVADGKNTWAYSPGTKTYTVTEGTQRSSIAALENILYGRAPANIQSAQLQGEESLEFEGHQVRCFVVRAEYARVPGLRNSQNAVRTVWLEKERDLVLKDVWEGKLIQPNGDPAQAHYSFIYSSIRTGGPMDEALFSFLPPEGSTRVAGTPANSGSPRLTLEPSIIAPPNVYLPPIASGDPSRPPAAPPASAWIPVQKVAAQYSEEARAAGFQGTAIVYVEVGDSRNPVNVELIAGLGMGLDEKALEAVKQWQFKPSSTTLAEAVEVPFQLEPEGWRLKAVPFIVERDRRKRVTSIIPPVLSHYVRPDPAACGAGTASVKLDAVIGTDGKPRGLKVAEGENSAINDAAMKAVEGWRFSPAQVDGKPAEANGTFDLECRSQSSPEQTPNLTGGQEKPGPMYRVGGGVSAPIVLSKVDPDYSEAARKAKYQGSVLLSLEVDPSGRARNIRVVRMLGMGLDAKAIEAVARWRFRPGMKEGKPVTVAATIEVNFRLL
ncbi:MAG TPA: TonB family protein [Bryobacteraceae bacterium]|nr:TonB family protein [Bryobacteraceae bacterium]